MDDCIFCKIAKKELPASFLYQDDEIMVFPDIHPVKPIHFLIVPKKHIVDFLDLDNDVLMGKMRVVIQKMIREQNLTHKGYRLSINGGGAQVIDHLHIHLMGPVTKAARM